MLPLTRTGFFARLLRLKPTYYQAPESDARQGRARGHPLSSHLRPHMPRDRAPAVGYSESRKMRLLPRRITPEIRSRKPYFARNAAITFSWSDGSVIRSARHSYSPGSPFSFSLPARSTLPPQIVLP